MRHRISPAARASAAIAAACLTGACSQPLMSVPPALAANADVYPVHGHQGFLLWNQISFGPYGTTTLHRGIASGEHSSEMTGLFSSKERDVTREPSDFVLVGPGAGPWRASCVMSSDLRTESQIVGFHFGTEGAGADREERVVVAQSGFRCVLTGPDGERWTLDTDDRLSSGGVRDEAGKLVVVIDEIAERGSAEHPPLMGNSLYGPDGELTAAVQRSFDGAVYLSRELDAKRRAAMAAVCTALLVPVNP